MNKQEFSSYGGAILTIIGSFTLNDWGVVMGILFGLFTVLINWYYKKKDFELRKAELEGKLHEKKSH